MWGGLTSNTSINELIFTEENRIKSGPAFCNAKVDSKDRGEFVARFLGVLELYRVGAISIEQAGPFSDFTVIWENSNFSDETLASLGTDYEGQ